MRTMITTMRRGMGANASCLYRTCHFVPQTPQNANKKTIQSKHPPTLPPPPDRTCQSLLSAKDRP